MDQQLTQNQIREFKNAFDLFDKDRDGVVSRQDLESTIAALGMKLSAGEIRDMVDEVGDAFPSIVVVVLHDTSCALYSHTIVVFMIVIVMVVITTLCNLCVGIALHSVILHALATSTSPNF